MKSYKCRDDVAAEMVGGEALIWDAEAGVLHRLNATAAAIWLSCREWIDEHKVTAGFDGAGAQAVPETLAELADLQLLRVRDECER